MFSKCTSYFLERRIVKIKFILLLYAYFICLQNDLCCIFNNTLTCGNFLLINSKNVCFMGGVNIVTFLNMLKWHSYSSSI